MSEESNTIEELREAVVSLTHEVVNTLGDIEMETAGVTLAQEAIRATGQAGLRYREACRVKSREEFYANLPTVVESIEEALYWLTLAKETGHLPLGKVGALIEQARETSARLTATRLSSARRSRGS